MPEKSFEWPILGCFCVRARGEGLDICGHKGKVEVQLSQSYKDLGSESQGAWERSGQMTNQRAQWVLVLNLVVRGDIKEALWSHVSQQFPPCWNTGGTHWRRALEALDPGGFFPVVVNKMFPSDWRKQGPLAWMRLFLVPHGNFT